MAVPLWATENVLFLLSLLISALVFTYKMFVRINRTRPIPVNWPVIGMLGGAAANMDRLFQYSTNVLALSDCTFVFKGPWFCGMDFVGTCDPANANHIFNTHFDNYPKGGDFRDIFDVFGDGLFTCDGDLWKHQRRVGHARMNGNRQFQSSITRLTNEKVVNGLLPVLCDMRDREVAFNLQDVLKRFAFDLTCRLVLGADPCSLAPNFPTTDPFFRAVSDVGHTLLQRHTVPRCWWKLKRLLGVGTEKRMSNAWQVIDRFIAQRIAEKREQLQKDTVSPEIDLLTLYLDNESTIDDSNKEYLQSDRFIRDSLLTFLSAGKDTTSAALSWFMYLISTHPDVEKKLVDELRSIHPAQASELVAFDAQEIEKLVYLHAALCESLRLYPPVPINHKCALKEDVLPSGHKIKPGTTIIFWSYAMARMEKIWGKDCAEFRPERWISDDGSKLKHQPSYKFLAFSCGPRTCLGKNMALTQMKIAAAAIVYNFRIEAAKGHKVELKLSIALPMKTGFMVKLTKRSEIN